MMKKMLFALMVIIASALIILPGAASDYVEPDFVLKNPKCCDLNECWDSFKIEEKWEGTHYIDGMGSITITMVNDCCFSFESEGIIINAVIVKGGPCAEVYNYYKYAEPVTEDTVLCPPFNPNSGKLYDISHIEFCYEKCWTPTPTPPPTTPTPVPEFPFYMPAMMAIFALAMGAVVVSLGKYR